MSVDLRLAVPVAVAWALVGILIGFPRLLNAAAILLWVVALAALLTAVILPGRRRTAIIGVAIATASAALLVSFAAQQEPQRSPPWLIDAAAAGRYVTAQAQTAQMVPAAELMPGAEPRAKPGIGRTTAPFNVLITSITLDGVSHATRIPTAVFADTAPIAGSGIGTTLTLGGTLAPTDAGDDRSFLFFASAVPHAAAAPPWYLDWANSLRTSFRGAAADLPGEGGDLLPGLSIGDTSAVSESLDTAMKSTSLSHLTAVSGANCAVVIALIMLCGGALRMPRTWRIICSMIVLLGFVVLVTPEPSVLRAAVMATLVLSTMLGGRTIRGVPTLAGAVLILLAIDPWLARSYGFILSVLATAGLLVLSGPLAATLSRWLPHPLAAVIAIPLAAQLACQPVLVLLNPTIPTFGVVANVLAGPAAPAATVLGLIACILVPFVPAIGMPVAFLAWVPSAWIAGVATFFAALPGNSIPWTGGVIGVAAATAVAGLLVMVALSGPGLPGRVASIALCLVLVVYLGLALGNRARVHLTRPADWQVAACDVGQGDAVIVRSKGSIALIDTGIDARLLDTCLQSLAIDHIDLLVLSHWDQDHVGGVSAVVGRVSRAIVGPSAGAVSEAITADLSTGGAQVAEVRQGDTGVLGELGWQVLWPQQRLAGVKPGNDSSIVVRFEATGTCSAGCLSILLLGDLGREPQSRLMAANRLKTVDVVKVAHHGSADQNSALYRRLRAAVGIVSVGLDNDYGHPRESLMELLVQAGTTTTRTDQEGMVLLSPRDDGGVAIFTEKRAPKAP